MRKVCVDDNNQIAIYRLMDIMEWALGHETESHDKLRRNGTC